MIQKLMGSILVAIFFICLVFTGNSFAMKYAFGLEKNNDVIQIYNVNDSSFLAKIDLDAEIIGETGIITAMATGPYERYLYFVTDNGAEAGKLYQVDLRGDISLGIPQYQVDLLAVVGVRPKAVVAGLYGNLVYVANYGSDSVSEYNRNLASTESVTGFNKPVAIAVTKGLSYHSDVFVANSGENTVTMFNGITEVVISVPNRPTDILVTPDYEYVYVCNSDPDSDPVSGIISVIKPVDYLDVDEDGDDIIDAGENTVIGTIEIPGALPTKMKMVRGGDYIYAINPVLSVTADNITFASAASATPPGTSIISVIDCSGRMNEDDADANFWSTNLTVANDLVGITTTKDGTSVYTVGGGDGQVFVTDSDTNLTALSTLFTSNGVVAPETFQDIHISGTMPQPVSNLTVESDTKGIVLLEWNNYDLTDTGVLIYRYDHDDDSKEYKKYLLEAVRVANLQSYEDLSVRNGKRYTYNVVPFNDVSRSVMSADVTIKAKDTSDTQICFITGTASDNNTMLTSLIIFSLVAFALSLLTRKTKV